MQRSIEAKLNLQANRKLLKNYPQFGTCHTHAYMTVMYYQIVMIIHKKYIRIYVGTDWHNQSLSSSDHDDDDVVNHRHHDHQWKYIWISKLFLWLFHHHKFIMQPGGSSGESSSCYATHNKVEITLHHNISFIHTDSELVAFSTRDKKENQ